MEKYNIKEISKDHIRSIYEIFSYDTYLGTVTLIPSPTGNCQMNSIANMNILRDLFLVENTDESELYEYDDEGLNYVRDFLINHRTKRCILFDVQKDMEEFMELLFNKDSIILKAPYNNTTENDMIIYYVDIENI